MTDLPPSPSAWQLNCCVPLQQPTSPQWSTDPLTSLTISCLLCPPPGTDLPPVVYWPLNQPHYLLLVVAPSSDWPPPSGLRTDPIASLINQQFSDTIPFQGNFTPPPCNHFNLWGSKTLLRSSFSQHFKVSPHKWPGEPYPKNSFHSHNPFSGYASGGLRNLPLTKQRFSLGVNQYQ